MITCLSVVTDRMSHKRYRFQAQLYRAALRKSDGEIIWKKVKRVATTFGSPTRAEEFARTEAGRMGIPFFEWGALAHGAWRKSYSEFSLVAIKAAIQADEARANEEESSCSE